MQKTDRLVALNGLDQNNDLFLQEEEEFRRGHKLRLLGVPAKFELAGRTTVVNTDGDTVHIGTTFGMEQIDRAKHKQKVPCQEQARSTVQSMVL